MKKLLEYLRPYTWRMAVQFLIKFTGSMVELVLPWILAHMINEVVPQRDVQKIVLWGALMLLCSGVALWGNVAANRRASWISKVVTQEMRHDLFVRTAHLSSQQVDQVTVSSLESRLTSDTYNINQMLRMVQRMGIRAPILLVGGILITLTLDPVLTLVLVATLPFNAYLVYRISRKGVPLYTSSQGAVDQMVRVVRENATGVRVIKSLSKTGYEENRFEGVNQEVRARESRASATMAASNPLMNLFLNLGLTAVVLLGAYRVDAGKTDPGTIIAFLSYFTIILNALLSMTRLFVMGSKGIASARRISEVLDLPEDMAELPIRKVETSDHITFEHVNFSYAKQKNDLTDISFSLQQGQTLGIIGPTGCGKTTIVNLLMRFYDPDSGAIRIHGEDVRAIPLSRLRPMFGVVFQNDVLFAQTVAENVDFGRGLSQEAVDKAIASAQADFVRQLEDGSAHSLTARGTNLSGGQKQRLLIARALAARPEILVLDDSSSALDYKTDAQLRAALRADFSSTTTIVVAQRVSSIQHADLILVLEDGRIVGKGTHEELMQSCESYQEIARVQMGGGLIAQ